MDVYSYTKICKSCAKFVFQVCHLVIWKFFEITRVNNIKAFGSICQILVV